MPFDRFLIAPFETGLQLDVRPWQVMDDAFVQLNNAYVFRGRVRKRFGSTYMGTGATSADTQQLLSRLRIQVGTIGSPVSPVPGAKFNVGQLFSAGNQIFTVITAGVAEAMLATGPGTGTFTTSGGGAGDFTLTGTGLAGSTPIYFYPAQPVMGLANYENGPINDQPSYAFDTQFAYTFTGTTGWQRSGTYLTHGSNSNFVWTANYRGISDSNIVLFTTNFQVANPNGAGNADDDPIWYTSDGATWTAATGANGFYFLPNGGALNAGPFVQTARIIIGFKNRLVLLNTIENNNGGGLGTNTAYPQRARFSFNGSPFAPNAWYEPNQQDSAGNKAAGAGYIDATTKEQIVSAEFIKDRLIVYFERSTWELVYTGNQILPFVWQKINTELGSEATFSSVPFDKVILTMGTTGVHACNGANVERIDNKIPDEIFEIQNKAVGVQRVAGIRDYFTEMVYWTFPGSNENPSEVYPNQVLVYNYKNQSWAINNDAITAFGYFEQQTDSTWATSEQTWEEEDQTWNSGVEDAQFRQIIAGNQEGYVFIVAPENNRNAGVLQITNMTYNAASNTITLVIIDHTLAVDDFINVENAQGVTFSGFGIYKVVNVIDANTINIGPITLFTGDYTGGGTAARVSNIQILSKQWNPYVEKDRNLYLQRIDFGVLKTSSGQMTVDYYPSASELSMIDAGTMTNSIMGTGVLETFPYPTVPLEQVQDRLWHPVYFQTDGQCIQIYMYMTDDQIVIPTIAESPFELDGMVLYTQPTTQRLN